jgi:hypothetical protein
MTKGSDSTIKKTSKTLGATLTPMRATLTSYPQFLRIQNPAKNLEGYSRGTHGRPTAALVVKIPRMRENPINPGIAAI